MNKFVPKPGQVDFINIRWAPVVNCVVKFQDKILLVKRSQDLNLYPGLWNGISGFLDDDKSLEEKVEEELFEEVVFKKENILSISLGEIFDEEAPEYKKTWIVHPVLVEVNTNQIKLDAEASEFAWVESKDINKYELLPSFNWVFIKLLPDINI